MAAVIAGENENNSLAVPSPGIFSFLRSEKAKYQDNKLQDNIYEFNKLNNGLTKEVKEALKEYVKEGILSEGTRSKVREKYESTYAKREQVNKDYGYKENKADLHWRTVLEADKKEEVLLNLEEGNISGYATKRKNLEELRGMHMEEYLRDRNTPKAERVQPPKTNEEKEKAARDAYNARKAEPTAAVAAKKKSR